MAKPVELPLAAIIKRLERIEEKIDALAKAKPPPQQPPPTQPSGGSKLLLTAQ